MKGTAVASEGTGTGGTSGVRHNPDIVGLIGRQDDIRGPGSPARDVESTGGADLRRRILKGSEGVSPPDQDLVSEELAFDVLRCPVGIRKGVRDQV